MVKLPYSVWAAMEPFRTGFMSLSDAASAALAAMDDKIRDFEQRLADYKEGSQFEGERAEDGTVIWELDHMLRAEIEDAEQAKMELRKGLIITAYHYWERAVQRTHKQLGGQKHLRDWDSILRSAQESGFAIDPYLPRVVTLANVLKHSNQAHGLRLVADWPELFPQGVSDRTSAHDWAALVEVSDDHLHMVFGAVSRSSPQRRIPRRILFKAFVRPATD